MVIYRHSQNGKNFQLHRTRQGSLPSFSSHIEMTKGPNSRGQCSAVQCKGFATGARRKGFES